MAMFGRELDQISTVQYGSHQTPVAMECLQCGQSELRCAAKVNYLIPSPRPDFFLFEDNLKKGR